MRYLAIDFGEKRTGLAVGDDVMKIATPVGTVQTSKPAERLRQIAKAIEQHSPDELVVGLPLNMDGTEGDAARNTRVLARQLTERFGLAVHLVDERLSTHAADAQMSERDLTRKAKKVRRDALAAATILGDFLRSRWCAPC